MSYALMYDSDNETYPDGVRYIAAYVDGSRTGRNYQRARAQQPQAKFLLISAVGDVDADVIDIEPGNVWPPSEAVDWTIRQRARGANPGYYCNTSTRQQVLNAYAARGVDPGWWWRADYSPVYRVNPPATLPLGETAWQYADPPITGSHWDVSIISPQLQAYLDGQGGISAAAINTTPIGSADLGGAPQPSQEDDLNADQDQKLGQIAQDTGNLWGKVVDIQEQLINEVRPGISFVQQQVGSLAGVVAGLAAAVSAMQGGGQLDMNAVTAAAEKGAQDALANLAIVNKKES